MCLIVFQIFILPSHQFSLESGVHVNKRQTTVVKSTLSYDVEGAYKL